ncbi:MAG: aryl-sulfate sulfotransferase [Candidatus Thorarchaeota archaeon]|jgi:hypothetical protein
MNTKFLAIVFISLFTLSLGTPLVSNTSYTTSSLEEISLLSENLPQNSTFLDAFANGPYLRVNNATQRMDGLTLLTVAVYPNYTSSGDRLGYVMVLDGDGNIVNARFYEDGQSGSPQMLNSTTCYYNDPFSGNITLWNIYTNATVTLPIDNGHHQVFINPITETVIIQERIPWTTMEYEGDIIDVEGDDVVEFDFLGNEIWRWEGNNTLPFNEAEFMQREEVRRGYADWTHSNAIYWDIDNDFIYINNRHLDCIVKIDHATGETVWVLGRYIGEGPGLTMYNQAGEEIESLWYHAHAIEMTGPNEFVIWDNDQWNLTTAEPGNDDLSTSRMVRFSVDETAMTATETWSYSTPYDVVAQGDCNALPNGNTIAIQNTAPEPVIVEVNEAGEVVWEYIFNMTGDIGWRLSPNGLVRFFEEPLVENVDYTEALTEGTNATVSFSLWDVFQRPYTHDMSIVVVEGSTTLLEQDIELLPHWQENLVEVDIANLAAGEHSLILTLTNQDDVSTAIILSLTVNSNMLLYVGIGAAAVVVVVVLVYFIKKK